MFEHRSLKWPVTLGVVMIVLLVALTVGWIILAVAGALEVSAPLYWTMLPVGTAFLVLLLVGVVLYLRLTIKEINLNRRQSNFVDSVTHELKSPIASLQLYLQTLNRRTVNPTEQQDFFRFMLDDVERLDHLINHLLVAARLQKPASGEENDAVDLDILLSECCQKLRRRYDVPPEQVHERLEPIVVHVRKDELDLVLRNLIDNAFKYAGRPPQIEISASMAENGRVVIQICDNGPGVPKLYRSKIFHRFFRIGDELTRQKPGTGLGLHIVKTLVRRMRGEVRVLDREGQSGVIFEVHLPGELRETVEARHAEAAKSCNHV